jgi:hypothetical protein
MHHLFNDWLGEINSKWKCQILAGAIAMCLAIWISRNDVVFDKSIVPSYLKVLFILTGALQGGAFDSVLVAAS